MQTAKVRVFIRWQLISAHLLFCIWVAWTNGWSQNVNSLSGASLAGIWIWRVGRHWNRSSFKRAERVFFGAGHVGETVPNAYCPLTRKLVTSLFKAGWLILAIADTHTDVWKPSVQCLHCSRLEHWGQKLKSITIIRSFYFIFRYFMFLM